MRVVLAKDARAHLEELIDEVSDTEDALYIATGQSVAVLVSQETWDGIQETLYLMSIPGMKESILEGKATPVQECTDEPGW